MKTIISLILTLGCSLSLWGQYNPTFGYFSVGRRLGSQSVSIKESEIELDNPYRIDYTIEGHYMTGDIYYVGKIYNSGFGKHSYTTPEGQSYTVTNGTFLGISMGAFETLSDELGIGYGLRGDFGRFGISNYNQAIGNLSLFIGPEVPVSFQFSRFLRLYAKGAIMNVWNDKVFNGLATELNVDLHLIPLSWIMVGAGVGFNSSYTFWEFEGERQRFGSSAAYFHFYLAASIGSCQNYN